MDMSSVIVPKSDQINADDLISGPMTVTIRDVKITGGTEQPVSIALAGTDKFYRPCKSMSRVLVANWGPDAKAYIGRSLTLYRDPTVKWGGMEVGGIRISHMSHIEAPVTLALTATRANRKPFTVRPLTQAPEQPVNPEPVTDPRARAEKWLADYKRKLNEAQTMDEVEQVHRKADAAVAKLAKEYPDLHAEALKLRPETQPPADLALDLAGQGAGA
jgi:hypothetical protein